jgi:hypothetical protein
MQPFPNPETIMYESRLTLARARASMKQLSDAEMKSLDRIHYTRERIQRTDRLLSAVEASWTREWVALPNCTPQPGPAESQAGLKQNG